MPEYMERRVGEALVLRLPDGRDVVVRVGRVERFHDELQVRLAFGADRDIAIYREEVLGKTRARRPSGPADARFEVNTHGKQDS